jgi:hypothetical protein
MKIYCQVSVKYLMVVYRAKYQTKPKIWEYMYTYPAIIKMYI